MPTRGRLLIVDDNQDIREVLALQLSACGFTTVTASSGRAALGMIDRFMPDAILCDVSMPGMDGRSFARVVQNNAKWWNIAMFAFSCALLSVAELVRLAGVGYKSVFTMPGPMDGLCDLLSGGERRASPRNIAPTVRSRGHVAETEAYR
jgi:CheY-like chemotaxis protein